VQQALRPACARVFLPTGTLRRGQRGGGI